MTQPHRDLILWATQLREAAEIVPLIVADLTTTIGDLDGYPTRTMSDGQPHGTTDSTPVERIASVRHATSTQLAQLIDDVTAVGQAVQSLVFGLRHAGDIRRQAAASLALIEGLALCDGRNFEGAEIPWVRHARLDAGNGWYDPGCVWIADESGLCGKCRPRERRWREHHQLAPRDMNTPHPTRQEQP